MPLDLSARRFTRVDVAKRLIDEWATPCDLYYGRLFHFDQIDNNVHIIRFNQYTKFMNLHHLKYFLSIAEEGSLSSASKKLLVGQSALSTQLKQFEEWLGITLFERQGKRLLITPSGEYVLKYARAIKNLENELMSNIGHAQDKTIKEITIGIQESVPKLVISQAVTSIRKAGSFRIKIIESTGEELMKLLMDSKIEFIITNFKPMSQTKEIYFTSLGKEMVSVWGTKKYLNKKKNFPKSLEGEGFILPGFQNQLRHDFEKLMFQLGILFEVVIEAQDTALQKELAVHGEGLLLMGEESVKTWVKSGQLHKIGQLSELKEEYWLGMVKKILDNSTIKSILTELQK